MNKRQSENDDCTETRGECGLDAGWEHHVLIHLSHTFTELIWLAWRLQQHPACKDLDCKLFSN